jgi:hypothetical protein
LQRHAGRAAGRRHGFSGTGTQANLADKAKTLGIPVWKFGDAPATAEGDA